MQIPVLVHPFMAFYVNSDIKKSCIIVDKFSLVTMGASQQLLAIGSYLGFKKRRARIDLSFAFPMTRWFFLSKKKRVKLKQQSLQRRYDLDVC